MDDEPVSDESRRDESRERAESRAPKRSWRKWPLGVFGVIVIVPALLLAIWTTIALNWSYSEGTRSGYIQKFSKKGWLCKTWEGELAIGNIPGSVPQLFIFSVRSDSIANEITRQMGSRVTLSYEEHRGVPTSCFGDTDYFVTGAKAVP
jgi:hypothetical protein